MAGKYCGHVCITAVSLPLTCSFHNLAKHTAVIPSAPNPTLDRRLALNVEAARGPVALELEEMQVQTTTPHALPLEKQVAFFKVVCFTTTTEWKRVVFWA
jgi:hypothetical protein